MKKIKNPAVILIISIYFIGMFVTFSGSLINQIQVVRHQNQIEKIANAEILEFSIIEWNNFSESNEIKFQNDFYDVISFEIINSKIFAKVVKDNFENETRITLSKIFNKTKSPFSEKKKSNSFSKHILSLNEIIGLKNINFPLNKLLNLYEVLTSKTSNYINFLEKPPC